MDIQYFTEIKDSDTTLEAEYKDLQGNRQRLTLQHNLLKDCPFCGGKVRLKPFTAYGRVGIQIICRQCQARMNLLTGKNLYTGLDESVQDVTDQVVEKWNKRGGKRS